ncbi:MAG: hypothetical protein V4549_03680 [Bacteroidota bacterium]
MIGKDFVFDGVSIPYTTAEGKAAGWYADVKWTGVATRNFTTSRQDFHGTIAKPTFADGKVIDISGEIFSTAKTSRGAAKNIIADLFKVLDFPSEDNELKHLEFTDDDGTDWYIVCKVYTMPQYDHQRGEPVITFSTQLYAPDPLILSAQLQTSNGIYGLWGGIHLPVELPIDLSGAINSLECVNSGNFAAKAKITIVGDILNPKIYNLTSGRFFQLNISMVAGDILIIDTESVTAELNGVSVLGDRADGSNWLFVNSGTNHFLLGGGDFDYNAQNKATILIEWHDTKIV